MNMTVRVASRYTKLSKEINFEKYGRDYIGYKVMNYDPTTKTLNSGADSRIKLDAKRNTIHTMKGKGVFLSNSKEYVLDYYAYNEYNAVIKYAFSLDDLAGTKWQQQLYDREPEITVRKAKVLQIEIYDEDHNLIDTI
jgi:hypothetical protein